MVIQNNEKKNCEMMGSRIIIVAVILALISPLFFRTETSVGKLDECQTFPNGQVLPEESTQYKRGWPFQFVEVETCPLWAEKTSTNYDLAAFLGNVFIYSIALVSIRTFKRKL